MLKTERMDRVRAALRAQGLTQMIVCDPKSVWYLTGVAVEPYERLLALYLPTEGEPVLFLNRLFNVPEPPCRTVWHTDTDKPVAQIAEVVDAGKPLGIDKEWPARFLIPLMETHPGMQVVLSSDCVDDCRACKDAEEQSLMREASRINDAVNEAAKHYIKAGNASEEKVAAAVALLAEKNPTATIVTTDWTVLTGAQIVSVMDGKRDLVAELLTEARAANVAHADEDEHEHHHHHHHDHLSLIHI